MRVRIIFWILVFAVSVLKAETVVTVGADTYANASTPATVYGASGTITANSNNGVRVVFLRFDLSSAVFPASRITLDLTSSGPGLDSYHVFGLTDGEGWDEGTLAWSNAPGINNAHTGTSGTVAQIIDPEDLYGGGEPLATFAAPGASDCHSRIADVTHGPLMDFIRADTDKIVTFLIVERDPLDGTGLVWHSRESSDANRRPKLTVHGAGDSWENLRVILVGGQSNADGRAEGSELPADLQAPQADIPFYYHTHNGPTNPDSSFGVLTTLRPGATQTPTGGFGPEITLGHGLSPQISADGKSRLAIIKYARGGTNLHTQWKAGGDSSFGGDGTVYQTWQRVVMNGISKLGAANPAARIDIAAMVWVQGESDVTSGASAAAGYEANLDDFIDDVRATVRPNLPFFLALLSENQTALSGTSDPNRPEYLTVRAAQENVAANKPGVHAIATDGPAFPMQGDGLHYMAAGYMEIGNRFAAGISPVVILRHRIERENDMVTLRWNAVPGRRYGIDVSGDLKNWSNIDAGVAGEWSEASTDPKRFYRVSESD